MKTADIVGGLIGMLIGLLFFWQSIIMPADVVMKIGPGFFPSLMAAALFCFSAILVFNALRGRSKRDAVEPLRLSDKGVQRGLIMLVAALIFVIVLEPLGFIPTAVVFLTLMMVVLGMRKLSLLLCLPILISAGVWALFEKVLHLSMPAGILSGIL